MLPHTKLYRDHVDYVRSASDAGADGLFLSINGAIPEGMARGVSSEQHEYFQKPYTLEVLKAAEGMVRVLHVHGNNLQMDRIKDYPYEVLSVSDRLGGNPSLADLRKMTDKCIMGGLDETHIQERCLPELAREIDDAITQAGREKYSCTRCTIPFLQAPSAICLRQRIQQDCLAVARTRPRCQAARRALVGGRPPRLIGAAKRACLRQRFTFEAMRLRPHRHPS